MHHILHLGLAFIIVLLYGLLLGWKAALPLVEAIEVGRKENQAFAGLQQVCLLGLSRF